MKVLHIIDSLLLGGAEVLLASFVVATQNEVDNEVCTLYPSDTVLNERIESAGIPLIELNSKRKYSIKTLFKLIRLIRDNHYDLIHVHLFPAQYYGAIAALFATHSHFIFTEHNVHNRRRESKIFRVFDKVTYKAYSKIICVGQLVEDQLLQYLPHLKRKATVIYNGINVIPPAEKNPTYDYDTLLVGSLRSNVKGVDILLKAISILGEKISRVAIAGEGILKNELILLRDRLGLQGKVDFLGNVDQVGELLERSRIFVMPSRFEGLPIALLEAMSKKKPIIASKVGGIPEVVRDMENGLLICPESPEELAEKLGLLLDSPELCEKLGHQAFETIQERYSIEKYAQKVLNEYKQLTKRVP